MSVVLVLGQSHWCEVIAEGLRSHGGLDARAVPSERPRDLLALLRPSTFRDADAVLRVGFRPGAHAWRGRLFDFVLHGIALRGRRVAVGYDWIGTDVADTTADVRAGRPMERFRVLTRDAFHLTDSEHLAAELAGLGITAEVHYTPAPNAQRTGPCPPFPPAFTAVTYIPDERPGFYGGQAVLECARRIPEARFLVARGTGAWVGETRPANLEFLGWLDDPAAIHADSTCCIRNVEHDGTSCMVLEALSAGRPVLYSERFPHTTHVAFGDTDALETALRDLIARFARGELAPDAEAAEWARTAADPATSFRGMAEAIERAIAKRRR